MNKFKTPDDTLIVAVEFSSSVGTKVSSAVMQHMGNSDTEPLQSHLVSPPK